MNKRVPVVTADDASENILPFSKLRDATAGISLRYNELPPYVTPTYITFVTGGDGGPGAMNATVDASVLHLKYYRKKKQNQ